MTRAERRQRDALTSLIVLRERNAEAMRGLESDRARMVAHGGLIPSPLWRQRGPTPRAPATNAIARPD